MISRQQYLQALEHPDIHVRSGVLRMFSEDRDPGLDVTSATLAAIDKFGVSEAFEFPHMVSHLAIDETGVLWALERASTLGDTSDAFQFLHWVSKRAPVAILRQRLPEIESIATGKFKDFPRLINSARQRVEFHDIPAQDCLSRLHKVVERCQERDDYPHDLLDEARLLCRRLVDGESLPELERLTQEWLSFDFDEELCTRHWFSGIAIELAGMLRLESAIPRLIEHFDYDWDWWNESIQRAISKMRSRKTVELCADIYPSLEWHGRLYVCDVFENPRLPEIEPTLSRLLKEESNDDLRVELASALALLGTPTAQAKARAVYRENLEDPERFMIAEILYYQFNIEGINDRDLPRWRAKMEHYRQMQVEGFDRIPEPQGEALFSSDIIPVDFNVGRNNPCPCGSGKKYKKCCLNP